MSSSPAPFTERESLLQNRWLILLAGIVCMVAVANYQYGWTLFVPSLIKKLGSNLTLVTVTFTVFVLLETWLVPFEGWLVDKFGPRNLVIFGGLVAGLGWVASASAATITTLYLAYALCGIGAGIVYGTAVGTALKWFPDHRGLAAGLTAAGFGAGAALTVTPIANQIATQGIESAFVTWGVIQGIVVVVFALLLKAPPAGWLPRTWTLEAQTRELKKRQTGLDFTPAQMAKTPQFWLLYVMMTMVATGGLMATAQLNPMAVDFKVDKIPVAFLWVTLPALQFALSIDRLVNGFTRPFWGWVSDRIGRELTMTLAFGIEALAIFSLIQFGSTDPILFVVLSGLTFFGWGEIYSLFPATCGDFFGRKFATANYGFLYTAKGTASVFLPIGAALSAGKAFDFGADALLLLGGSLVFYTIFIAPTVLKQKLGTTAKTILYGAGGVSIVAGLFLTVVVEFVKTPLVFDLPKVGWFGVFTVAVVFDICAATLAFFVLRRMRVPAGGERPTVGVAAARAPASAGD